MSDINRKLGIVPVGTPDMNPLYSASAAIDSEINTFKITSIRNTSNISDQFNIFSKQNIINFNSSNLPNNFSLKQSLTGIGLGRSIATSKDGTVFVIGNSLLNGAEIYTGNLNNTWRLKQSLINNTFSGVFGERVSINTSGTVIVLNANSGVTLIYTGNAQSNWVLKQTLSGNNVNDSFARNLTINNSENVLAIGRPTYNGGVGGASIYTGNSQLGWRLKQEININSGSGAAYGTSIAMNDNATVLMMGGPSDSYPPEGGIIFGGALIYTGNPQLGWNFKQKLSADSFADEFGTSVAINKDGTVLAMGGIYDAPNDPGSVMVFTGNSQIGWGLKQKLIGDSLNDNFGASVSINDLGSVIVMGGPLDDDGGNNAGAAIVYSGTPENGWQPMQKITGNSGDRLGRSTAINSDGTMILIAGGFNSLIGGISGRTVVYTGNFLDNLYQINPNNENIVEVGTEPLIIKVSGAWSGNGVKWEASKDKINWTGFNLRENFNLTGQTSLTNSGVFVFSGNIPNGYPYLRLQNLRNKIDLITDTRREESARTRTSWTPPNYTSSGTIYGNLIYYSPDNSNFESEWPKPCEYFNNEILASEFPVELKGINELGMSIPYIISSGISGYNIIQSLLNTSTGMSSVIDGSFFEKSKYEFAVKQKIVTGNQIAIVGNIISLNPLATLSSLAPSKLIGTFLLETSGDRQNLITFFNNSDNNIYYVESKSNNQSTTYQVDNTIHICGE